METKLFRLKVKRFKSSVSIDIKMIYLLILFAVASAPNGFSQNNELSDAEKQKIKSEIQQRIDEYCDAFSDMDKEWFRGFWAGKELVFAGDGKLLKSFDTAIAEPIDNLSANYKELIYCNLSTEDIIVLGQNAASCVVTYDWRLLMTSGDTLQSKGSWLYVFVKNDNQWKVVHTAGTHIYY